MKNVLTLVGGVFFLLACNVDKGKKVDVEKLDFKTTDRSELFFKNMRQSAYTTTEQQEAGVYLYTHKTWDKDSLSPVVPTIVFNWRQDRAYLMLNWSEKWSAIKEIDVTVSSDTLPDYHLIYREGNMRDQLTFSATLYNAMMDGGRFALRKDGEKVPLFTSDEKREAFRVTLYDYLRLTGWF
ncbi:MULTISPECIES: hypothetical protein [unclassified Imperialibacter]|uniref:hypothetical protein n=1 Tax=unclassified Imperialibacter TaxID=2629706 RepID=UPI00125C5946|nr:MULTISPECIES: hypothetical protein [unclassified Imperialibacter]CAD5269471.1 conserved hypothetical protein [Imperialibacter sp. 89]CAD5297610.1 conserved hypothetical protein [Imperialibacter sp. 75]VVT34152.1 conserved hypothetical protein [Imperialibacter sp. EC-SDR9]